MKRFLSVVLCIVLVACTLLATSCAKNTDKDTTVYKVAMITDYGDITDESFNQTTYEACQAFCKANNVTFQYFKPAGDNTSERVAQMEKAIDQGFNVIVMPGYAFAGAIVDVAPRFKDVKFVALDVGNGDLLEAAVTAKGETYNYNPDSYKLSDYVDLSNVYCAVYQEELCGYMAGYAAVMLGFENLGFLGGMAVPAVIRYGYGFVQGADDAASFLGKTVNMKYVYGGQFSGDADITAVMDTWCQGGTDVIFACGGGIYSSACEAAIKTGCKIIGVDVDQKSTIDSKYNDDTLCITSAMKGLYPATYDALTDIVIKGNWSEYAGKIVTLGLVSATDPTANYVQIPTTTSFVDGKFTMADYTALVAKMYNGEIQVSNDTTVFPATTHLTVDNQGSIK